MKRMGYPVRLALLIGISGVLLFGGVVGTFAAPHKQDAVPPASQALDLAAEALGWTERSGNGTSISHVVKSGDVQTLYLIKWGMYPASYYYYAGNQPGLPFGESDGYQWGSGCTTECNPPTRSDYFQFNFDFDEDGDKKLDTPAGRYLGYFCEVTVTAPAEKLVSPGGEAMRLCTVVRDKALQVRSQQKKIFDNPCIEASCPQAACLGSVSQFDGACNPETGKCYFRSQEDCGAAGCDPLTGRCSKPQTYDPCAQVICEPAMCVEGDSYYDPFCNPETGVCEYSLEDCEEAGCNDATGRCNQALCGGVVCEPAQCIDNRSFYDPECVDGECQYSLEDCGDLGCNPGTGRCNPPSAPGGCNGAAGLAAAIFLFAAIRFFRSY